MHCRAQAERVRKDGCGPIERVMRAMVQRNVNGHGVSGVVGAERYTDVREEGREFSGMPRGRAKVLRWTERRALPRVLLRSQP